MTLNFLTIAICLLLLAALPELAKLRVFDWFEAWLRWLNGKLQPNGFWASGTGLAIALAPIALILLAVLGQGVGKIIAALVTVQWAYYARTVRGARPCSPVRQVPG